MDTNFNIIKGDSFAIQVTYKDSSGLPINLTGASITMMVKDQADGEFFCASATVGNGITITSASSGIFKINLSSLQTRNFNVPESSYQVQLLTAGGDATTILRGRFIVDPGVIY